LLSGIVLAVFFVRQDQQGSVIKTIQSDCHFEHGLCKLVLSSDVTLSFKITPKEIPAMEPLYLTITGFDGFANTSHLIKVWFEGRDMSMGQHFMLPVQDGSLNDAHLNNRLTLSGMIPVCSVDQDMIWRLVVELPLVLEQEKTFNFPANSERQQIHFELL